MIENSKPLFGNKLKIRFSLPIDWGIEKIC